MDPESKSGLVFDTSTPALVPPMADTVDAFTNSISLLCGFDGVDLSLALKAQGEAQVIRAEGFGAFA